MGERSDEIARQIERTRGDLGANLQELEGMVKDFTDWHSQFQKHPLIFIGTAFCVGILLSAPFDRRSNLTGCSLR